MAFEPSYEKLVSSYRAKLGSTQAVIECKLPANENSNIKKVLCANAKATITGADSTSGEVKFNGVVNFQVIYETDDAQTESMDYSAEFSDKMNCEQATDNMIPVVTANIIDVNTNTNDKNVKVVAVVEINVDGITNNEVNVLVGARGEGVFENTESMNFSAYSGVASDKFEETFDLEINDNIAKVLAVCTSPFIETVTPSDKFLKLQGGVNVTITYLTADENPTIRSFEKEMEISREVALDTILENSVIQSDLSVIYSDIKVTTNIDQNSAIINLNVPVVYKGYVFNNRELEVITDVFSTENYLTVSTESVKSLISAPSKNYVSKITGSVIIDDAMPFIDEILGTCCGSVTVASSMINNNSLILEGIAYVTVVYYNKELNSNNSIMVESPFSLNLDAKNVPDNFMPIINISLGEVSARSKRGKEIEVGGNLYVYADFYNDETGAVIKEINVGEDKPENSCVLSVYVVKVGDTLWDIAKLLNVSPDMILEQNPNLVLPLVGGEKIVIYRQRECKF